MGVYHQSTGLMCASCRYEGETAGPFESAVEGELVETENSQRIQAWVDSDLCSWISIKTMNGTQMILLDLMAKCEIHFHILLNVHVDEYNFFFHRINDGTWQPNAANH